MRIGLVILVIATKRSGFEYISSLGFIFLQWELCINITKVEYLFNCAISDGVKSKDASGLE